MTLNKPYLILLGIALLLAYVCRFFQLGKAPEVIFPKTVAKGVSFSSGLRFLLFMIACTGLGMIAFSMGQPRRPLGYAKNNIEVNDIFLVVDVSRSMLAEDFPPNRLTVAKEKIREFVSLRPTDRIGIIMFSERAFTLLPLSTDLKLIDQMIDDINVGFLGAGTNIGDALALAVGRASQSLAENKVIILLTDGVSNVGNMTPIQAAEEAKKIDVKVYTIGIGRKANKKVLRNGSGRGFQRLPGGSVDLDTLDKISKITNGKSFYAADTKALSNVLGEIQKLEKTEIETSAKIIYKEEYWRYLLIGLTLFILGEYSLFIFYREAT